MRTSMSVGDSTAISTDIQPEPTIRAAQPDTATAIGTADPRRPLAEVPDLRGPPDGSEAAAFPRPQNSMVRRANGTPDDASAGMRRGKAVHCDGLAAAVESIAVEKNQ